MIEHKRFGPLTLLLFVLLCASTAFAAPVCVDGSFSAYAPLNPGDPTITCQYQDLIFSFAYNALIYQKDPSQASLAPGDRVENHVTISFVNPAPGIEGFILAPTANYLWFGANGFSADVNFTYGVTAATPGKPISQANFDLDATIGGPAGGGILAGETICCPQGTNASPDILTLQINQFTTGTGSDSGIFARNQTTLSINKDLLIATIGAGDVAYLNSFQQTFQVGGVPEPGVWVLTAGGLGFLLLRRRKAALKGLSIVAAGCLVTSAANAAPLCTSVGNKLNQFIAVGSCDINGTLFTFNAGSYSYVFSGGPGLGNAVAASDVDVTVQTGANPGFQFVGQWAASIAQSGTLTLQFTASAPSGFTDTGALFSGTTSKSGLGTVTGTASVTNGVPPVGYTFPPGNMGTPIAISPSLPIVTLKAIVTVSANGSSFVDNAHLSNLTMSVTEAPAAPEPATAAVLGGGLVLIGLVGRKRLSR